MLSESGTAAPLHLHVGQLALDHVLVGIKVEHVDGRHLAGGAAGTGGAVETGACFLDEVGVRSIDTIS